MSAKIKYTDEPIEAKVIKDFLPPPEELAFREEGVKVTMALSKKSVEFFKSEASKYHTHMPPPPHLASSHDIRNF